MIRIMAAGLGTDRNLRRNTTNPVMAIMALMTTNHERLWYLSENHELIIVTGEVG